MYPFTRRANSPNNNTSQFTFLYPNNNNNYLPSNFPWEGHADTVQNASGRRSNTSSIAISSLSFSNVNQNGVNVTHGIASSGLSTNNTLSMNFGRYTFSHSNGVTTFRDNDEAGCDPVYVFHGQSETPTSTSAHEATTAYCAKRQRPVDSQPYTRTHAYNTCANGQNLQSNCLGIWNYMQQNRTTNGSGWTNYVHQNRSNSVYQNRCQKRTMDEAQMRETETLNPHKQFITEEKVAAQLKSLHLSNDHCYHSNGLPARKLNLSQRSSNGPCSPERMGSVLNDDSTRDKKEQGRKRDWKDLSWEINPAFKDIPKANPLPECLLNEINKPCLAVVPWKPPEDFVDQICSKINDERKEDADYEDDDEKLFTYLGGSDEIVHGYDELSFSWENSSEEELDDIDMDELSL